VPCSAVWTVILEGLENKQEFWERDVMSGFTDNSVAKWEKVWRWGKKKKGSSNGSQEVCVMVQARKDRQTCPVDREPALQEISARIRWVLGEALT
jgi:hypothetical protein